jgi:peptidoglycan L-alanyl-D-glutamate endopeptidase CwlK
MPSFSPISAERLAECCTELQEIFNEVVKHYDCTILCGYRGEKKQNEAFHEGTSTLRFPMGKHNQKPSLAVDAPPFPVIWENKKRFHVFAGFVLGIATKMGYKLRWGGDWDGDWIFTDQRLHDLPHFEYKRRL